MRSIVLLFFLFQTQAWSADIGCSGRTLPISLKDLLQMAYSGQPRLVSSREDVEKARYNLLSAKAPFLPSASASLVGEKFVSKVPGAAATSVGTAVVGGSSSYSSYPSISVNWNIYSGGRDLAAYRGAQAVLTASKYDLTSSLNDILGNALLAYGELLKTQHDLQEKQQVLSLRREILDRSEELYGHGRLNLIRLGQARIDLSRSERDEYQVCRNLTEKSGALARAIGIRTDPDQILTIDDALPDSKNLSLDEHEVGKIAEEDPGVKSAREKIVIAQRRIDEAQAGLYPTVSLYGRYDWLGQSKIDYSQAFNGMVPNSFRVGITLQQSIGPFITELASIRSAKADLVKAQAAYEEAYIDVQNRLRNGLNEKNRAELAFQSEEKSAGFVTKNLELAKQLFSRGMTDENTLDNAKISSASENQLAFELSIDAKVSRWLAFRVLHPDRFAPDLLQKAKVSPQQ